MLSSKSEAEPQNDELLNDLDANLQKASFNQYNLVVFLSIARLNRHNLQMIQHLGAISDALEQAQSATDPAEAVKFLDAAIDLAEQIHTERDAVLRDLTATWNQSWYPRISEVNGRKYLNEADDVKDHLPMRRLGLDYLVDRELLYPLGVIVPPLEGWAQQVGAVRNHYARAHNLPTRTL